jgi:hypothetical protein
VRGLVLGLSVLFIALPASAAEPRSVEPDAPPITIATTPPEGQTGEVDTTLPAAPAEAPPPRPRKKGVVLESTAGVLGFAGQLRHVSPPGFWLHTQLGYEITNWLMVFGEGELGYTDTSVSEPPNYSTAFPIWGFGGGLRGTIHPTERFAFFVQGEGGALTAHVPHGTLAVLGFKNAESLGAQVGGRLGLEWYMADRHLALVAQGGGRDAMGFARQRGSDLPLMWDAAVGLRYTF